MSINVNHFVLQTLRYIGYPETESVQICHKDHIPLLKNSTPEIYFTVVSGGHDKHIQYGELSFFNCVLAGNLSQDLSNGDILKTSRQYT